METISITTEYIKLDQFLKWAGVVSSGFEAKELIYAGKVLVNGNPELQRGKKIRKNDIVVVQNKSFKIE